MARMVKCVKLGRDAEGLDFPPYPGELGKRIYENVSKEAWQAWIKHQTMLINENKLNLADPRARKYLAEQMEKHFFGSGADVASRYVPPDKDTLYFLELALTPIFVPGMSTSAPRRANNPLVTTPAILLTVVSSSTGLRMDSPRTSRTMLPLSVAKPSRSLGWPPSFTIWRAT